MDAEGIRANTENSITMARSYRNGGKTPHERGIAGCSKQTLPRCPHCPLQDEGWLSKVGSLLLFNTPNYGVPTTYRFLTSDSHFPEASNSCWKGTFLGPTGISLANVKTGYWTRWATGLIQQVHLIFLCKIRSLLVQSASITYWAIFFSK